MANPKVFAFYLPQFHAIPENDEWWGKGFTEWTNVKKATPLFKGHNQPRIPLNDNYYNLMDPSTFAWQVDLAKKYSIDGFCFYHYWFNGKLLLEKPLEMYREHPEWDLPYCFSWANEPWARTWDGQNTNVLMPQTYAGMDDIRNHFNYMLPFFKDNRYIKIDNKPVYVLYRTNSITYLDEMIEEWTRLAIAEGWNGIYFVETLSTFQSSKIKTSIQSSVYFEPAYSFAKMSKFEKCIMKIKKIIKICPVKGLCDYNDVWNNLLKKEVHDTTKWGGAFLDWDNTARKGVNGCTYSKVSPVLFEKYFSKLYRKSKSSGSPYIFVNAWNEWCEGTYLEPDVKNEYGFLEAIKRVVNDNN